MLSAALSQAHHYLRSGDWHGSRRPIGARRHLARRGSSTLAERVQHLIASAGPILPFDEAAAQRYGPLRATLEREGRRLAEPDLRIAAIALSREATLVTGNVRHFARVPDLRVENWLADDG